jgi:hypothetical protein
LILPKRDLTPLEAMTLEDGTAWALAAMQAGDLDSLAHAIQARRHAIESAIASGLPPAPHIIAEAIEAGERLCGALEALKRELNLESVRLQHWVDGFSREQARATRISLRG